MEPCANTRKTTTAEPQPDLALTLVVTARVDRMRQGYTAPTNKALIALAVRLQWITVAIDIHQDEMPPQLRCPQQDSLR